MSSALLLQTKKYAYSEKDENSTATKRYILN